MDLCGPSYTLNTRKADIQRAVNLYLMGMEAPGKAPFILHSIPGLIQRASAEGEVRGGVEAGSRSFVVIGPKLYEFFENNTLNPLGSLNTSAGPVSMAYGLFQVVLVDGSNLYVFQLSANTFQRVESAAFTGADTVDFIDNYFTLTRDRAGEQFQITAINDATSIDALDFASAESSPDDLVSHLVVQQGILLFGTLTMELHVNTGASDFPFERSRGSGFQVGLLACHSLRDIDNGAMWLGRDRNGSGIVYRLNNGQPQRVSTQAIEQSLQKSSSLRDSTAYVTQRNGLTFYCLNAPDLPQTWCYEVSTGTWHERCELDDYGQFTRHRAEVALFSFDKHFVGDKSGVLYEESDTTYTLDGDPLVRERVTPHDATIARVRQMFNRFWLDCSTGESMSGEDPQVELSYSKDSGKSWSDWIPRSFGKIGEIFPRLVWTRLGMGRDRVWRVRFSGNAPFAIVAGGTEDPGAK